jgi:outer membrane protein assembly factor BamB
MNLKRQGLELNRSLAFFVSLLKSTSLYVIFHVVMATPNVHSDDTNLTQQSTQRQIQKDWPQWGGSPQRNNAPESGPLPATFNVKSRENIRWQMPLGSESYGSPVVANGKVYVGTNNYGGYLDQFPKTHDLGVLLCLNENDGKFLWQYSAEKLSTGRIHDMPNQGICCSPMVEGERLWMVTNRCEVVCVDTLGFTDRENDGPFVSEENENEGEADIVWKFDMMSELNVTPHNMSTCSVTSAGDLLFVSTSQGMDDSHQKIPDAKAPSLICMNRNNGKVLWTDNTPGENIMHAQWSSPAYAVLGGQEQVLYGAGDGWLYSFDPKGDGLNSKILWSFDCNPKDSVFSLNVSTRLSIVGTPVIYDGLVYVVVGEDPEHGESPGRLWCIDPTKRGDVSPTLVFNSSDPSKTVPRRRKQALIAANGDFEKDNPSSAAVWQYVGSDPSVLETTMHRTCGSVAIKNDLLYLADFSGILHCLNAKTGVANWTHDLRAASWASPLIADNKVYLADEDGDVLIVELSAVLNVLAEINLGAACYTTPIVANDTIFICIRNELFAICL